jgi:hypothetical protein
VTKKKTHALAVSNLTLSEKGSCPTKKWLNCFHRKFCKSKIAARACRYLEIKKKMINYYPYEQ